MGLVPGSFLGTSSMQLMSFIKKLQIFKVIYGRASTILRGLNDGGQKAIEINDENVAKVFNGRTIFNVNNPVNECGGGHFHTADTIITDPSKICLHFEVTDWVDHKIEVIAAGTPTVGQIGPHNLTASCVNSQVWQDETSRFREVGVEIRIDPTTKSVTLWKSPRYDFKGRVILMGV